MAGEIKPTPAASGTSSGQAHTTSRYVASNGAGYHPRAKTSRTARLRLRRSPASALENVQETSADLHAKINPVGYETDIRRSNTAPRSAYGNRPAGSSGEESARRTNRSSEELHLSGLTPTTTIHYRSWRPTNGGPRRRTTRPSTSGHPTARTRTCARSPAAAHLPDCRAYELVTPGYAGAVQIMPGEGFVKFAEVFGGNDFAQAPQNFGRANSPPRFSYWGALGSVKGIDAPNTLIDCT